MSEHVILTKMRKMDIEGSVNELFVFLYVNINEMFKAGAFEEVNEILAGFKTNEFSKSAIIALLSFTNVAAAKLPKRTQVAAEALQKLTRDLGDEKAKKALRGLI